jgi:hypothetical protein
MNKEETFIKGLSLQHEGYRALDINIHYNDMVYQSTVKGIQYDIRVR